MADAKINVILHGLLFLEYQDPASPKPWLKITAPDLRGNHDLFMGTLGNLVNINGKEIDWRYKGLTGSNTALTIRDGVPTDVPNSIFQFSRKTTEIGDIDKSGHQGKIFLPWPESWNTIRQDTPPPLTTRLRNRPLNKRVATEIGKRCGYTIGVATVLTYKYPLNFPPLTGWSPTLNIQIYFQPKTRERVTDVNADLRTASRKLFSSDNFDLAIKDSARGASTPIGRKSFPMNSGLSIADELSLNEKVVVVDPHAVSSTIRDAISVLATYLEQQEVRATKHASRQRRLTKAHASAKENSLRLSFLMANPANCPTMFLGNP